MSVKQNIKVFTGSGAFDIRKEMLKDSKDILDNVEVTDAVFSWGASSHLDTRICHRWGFNIGGTANAATGRVASWTSAKTIKLMAREYGSSNESKVHGTQYTDNTGTDSFSRPCIGITAIGSI